MATEPTSKPLRVRIPTYLWDSIRSMAKAEGLSASSLVRRAIRLLIAEASVEKINERKHSP